MFSLAGIYYLVMAMMSLPDEITHALILKGFILLGCGAGIAMATADWLIVPIKNTAASQKIFYGLAGFLGISIFLSIWKFGMCQFGGFDHSVVVEVGWRLIQGQKVHVDFPCTLPVGFFLGAKYAFKMFGVRWESLIFMTAGFSLMLYAWSLWLALRVFSEKYLALLLAVTIQAMSMVLVSYWWYNPITSATAALFLLSATLLWHHAEDKSARASYFCALLLIALMKPNIAGIIVPLITIVFLFSRRHRIQILILSALAFATFILFLKLNDVNFSNLLKGYFAVAQRGMSMAQFLQDLCPTERLLSKATFVLAIVPALISIITNFTRMFDRCPWLGLAGIVGGSYGFLTNGEMKLVDLVPVLIGSFLVTAELRKDLGGKDDVNLNWSSAARRYVTASCIILTISGLAQGIMRERVFYIGLGTFFQYSLPAKIFPDGFFKGLHSGDIFLEMNQQIEELIRKEPNSTIAFGPRMQWGYAVFNKPSPRYQPIWWHAGVAFAKSDEPMYVNGFFERHFDLLILNKNDVILFPDYFIHSLGYYYTIDQSYSRLTVLRRKKFAGE